MQNDEAITTLNNPDDLGIYSNSNENNIENLSSLDENFYGFANLYIDDIKKIESKIAEVKSQLSNWEFNLNSMPPTPFFKFQRDLANVNISVLKEKLNELNNELQSLMLKKNKYKKVPVSSFKLSVPLENQNINDSIIRIKELKSKDAIKEMPNETNITQGRGESEAASKTESTVDDKILGMSKGTAIGVGIGVLVLLTVSGILLYKKYGKK